LSVFRRAKLQRRHFFQQTVAERAPKFFFQEFRKLSPHRQRRLACRRRRDGCPIRVRQRGWRVTSREQTTDIFHAVIQQRGNGERTRSSALHAPGQRSAVAQDCVDTLADGGAVLGTGETMRPPPVAQMAIDGLVCALQFAEYVDHGLNSCGRCHG
jgi:hypothetical protein